MVNTIKKKILTIILMLTISVPSFCGWGLFGASVPDPMEYLSWINQIASTANDFDEYLKTLRRWQEEVDRWEYLFKTLDPSDMAKNSKDFFDWANRYLEYSSTVSNTFKELNNFDQRFMDNFASSDVIKNWDRKKIEQSIRKTEKMSQDTVKDSMKIVASMTGSTNTNQKYEKQQEQFAKRLASGSIDPNKIMQMIVESQMQTNQILMEMKSLSISQLQQMTILNQERIEKSKRDEELEARTRKVNEEAFLKSIEEGKKVKGRKM